MNLRQQLIKAICHREMDVISDFLDEDVLHFGCYKRDIIERIRGFLFNLQENKTNDIMVARVWKCRNVLTNEALCCTSKHLNPVRFEIGKNFFIWDIKPNKNGLFSMDICKSYNEKEVFFASEIFIPEDIVAGFQPDENYLQMKSELQKVLKPFNQGEIIFWFPEDLAAWVDNHQDFLDSIQDYSKFDFFGEFAFYFDQLEELDFAMHKIDDLMQANAEFESIKPDDKCGFNRFLSKWCWFTNYIFLQSFNYENIDKGYFTFRDFFPNLRFYVRGQEEYFKFLEYLNHAKFSYEDCDEILNYNDEKDSNDLDSIPF
ncbi:MAG: hypothetical protein KA536_15830 [Saprospiraceae bacterium]|nr:hypothetical protein [Saprospiraceae bacterium]